MEKEEEDLNLISRPRATAKLRKCEFYTASGASQLVRGRMI